MLFFLLHACMVFRKSQFTLKVTITTTCLSQKVFLFILLYVKQIYFLYLHFPIILSTFGIKLFIIELKPK